jgi:hypothetical protein
MKLAEIPFAVLRFQYQIARIPLQLIEDQMATRLYAEAPVRLFYERSLGSVDAAIGNLLGDPKLKQRGTALVERSDALSRAAKLDAEATARREQADAKLDATHDDVVTDIQEAREATEQEAIDARITAAERKRAADDAAEKRAAAAKKQADDFAAQRKNAAQTAKRQEENKIRAAEKNATEAAKAKLDDAQTKRSEAERKRAQADRVEELAEAEKQKRKSERAKTN